MDTIYSIIGITFMYSTPLILASLGGVISEKVGVIALEIEGLMTIGAFVGALVGHRTSNPWIGFLAGGIAGMVLVLPHAIASISLKADQTITGIAINFIGPGLALFLCRIFYEGSTMTKPVPTTLPKLFDIFIGKQGTIKANSILGVLNADITFYIAVLLTIIMWYVFYKTKAGLRIIAVGEQPAAADSLGINVYFVRYMCVLTCGFLAGLAGASISLKIVNLFTPAIISGKGFIAIAAVIFGKWKPQGALLACLVFGMAQGLSVIVAANKNITIPSQLISMIPYVLTIVILIVFVGKSSAPKAGGIPFEKGLR